MARYRKVKDAAGRLGYARQVPFTYVVNITSTALAAGGTLSGAITIDTGLPFILTEMGCANDADTSTLTVLQNLLFSILDGETQQQFSNGPIPRERMFGTRDFPRQLPSEVELSPGDTITVTMTNQTGGALTSITRITLTGYKLVGFSAAPIADN